jgi:hypothetical protein
MTLRTVCLSLLLFTMIACGETIIEGGLQISVTVPKGAENLKAIPAFAKMLLAVGWRDEKEDLLIRMLMISDMGGPIGREDFAKEFAGAASKPGLSLVKFKWKEFEIDTIRVEEEARGKPWVTFNAQVPTVPHAVQVQVFGPATDEKELRQLLADTLDSLESKTNWLTMSERIERITDGLLKMGIAVWVVAKLW